MPPQAGHHKLSSMINFQRPAMHKKNWRTVGPHFCMALHAVSARHAMSENGALKREYAMKFQSRKFQTYVFSQAAKPLQGGTGKWCVKWLPLPPWHHWRSRASDSSASQHLTCDTNDGDREGELVKTNMKDHENACLSSMVNSELWTPSLSQLPFFLDTASCTHSWCAHFYVGMECLRSLAPPFLLVRNPVLDAQTPIGTTSQHTHLWSP